jgi:hypothetical protein
VLLGTSGEDKADFPLAAMLVLTVASTTVLHLQTALISKNTCKIDLRALSTRFLLIALWLFKRKRESTSKFYPHAQLDIPKGKLERKRGEI